MKTNLLSKLEAAVSSQTDAVLARELFEEAASLEKAFALRSWKYSQLDGGRVCEVVARICYGADAGSYNRTKSVEDCIGYVENDHVAHGYVDRQALMHIVKVVKATYKLRSQRGGVHVTPKHSADEIDSRLILECCRWLVIEICRLFGSTAKDETAELLVYLSRYPVALVRQFGNRHLLQATGYSTEEETLMLIYFAPDQKLTTKEVIESSLKDQSGVRKSIKALRSSAKRHIVDIDGLWTLTDLGAGRVGEIIQSKVK